MSDHPKDDRAPDLEAAKSGYAEHAPDDSAQSEGAPDNENQADFEAFMRLAKENEDLKDKSLRLAAEMENLRRRTARDVHDARNYAIANFARDMLTVSDNLRRALDAVPAPSSVSAP